MARKTVIIPENRETINKIKDKYSNLEGQDKTAQKIARLEVVSKNLKTATNIVGIITAIDLVIPDATPLIDEAILAAITALLKATTVIIDKKIEALSNEENMELQNGEIENLVTAITDIINRVKNKPITK